MAAKAAHGPAGTPACRGRRGHQADGRSARSGFIVVTAALFFASRGSLRFRAGAMLAAMVPGSGQKVVCYEPIGLLHCRLGLAADGRRAIRAGHDSAVSKDKPGTF